MTSSLDAADSDDRSLSEQVPGHQPSPLETLTLAIEDEALVELLDKLPLEQRETFQLKVAGEMTFEEIGAAMKCSVNTAKSRYRYALDALRTLVNRQRFYDKIAG